MGLRSSSGLTLPVDLLPPEVCSESVPSIDDELTQCRTHLRSRSDFVTDSAELVNILVAVELDL